jgi:hypothetical protein
MSHVTPAPLATSDTEWGAPTAAPTLRSRAPVPFTENQTAFCTAAAAPVGSTRRRWRDTTLVGGLGRILTALTQPRAPLYPRRKPDYFEAARMSREMDRL